MYMYTYPSRIEGVQIHFLIGRVGDLLILVFISYHSTTVLYVHIKHYVHRHVCYVCFVVKMLERNKIFLLLDASHWPCVQTWLHFLHKNVTF
jgi:hypothetical protein